MKISRVWSRAFGALALLLVSAAAPAQPRAESASKGDPPYWVNTDPRKEPPTAITNSSGDSIVVFGDRPLGAVGSRALGVVVPPGGSLEFPKAGVKADRLCLGVTPAQQ